jgi:hypothetical protein
MPSTNARNLTLDTIGANTEVRVQYNAIFGRFERFCASNGLIFRERIAVIGVDPPGSTTGTVLHNFPPQNLPVTPGATPQTIARDRSITVPKASLNEDPGLGDDDEILCKITIELIGFPATIVAFTDQEILPG